MHIIQTCSSPFFTVLNSFYPAEGKAVEIMGLFSNKISRNEIKLGDHIYSWRNAYAYAHHGIYVGSNKVVHFTRASGQELGTGTILDSLLSSSVHRQTCLICPDCGFQRENSGVTLSCLDCFLGGGFLYRFEYGVAPGLFLAKARGGTCTLAESDPSETVVHRAMYLLQNGFGNYHIFQNNCEDFAIYCKTGLLVTEQNALGRSGQAASVIGAPLAAALSSPFKFLVANPLGLATVTAGVYCFSRYATDIGVRTDVVKVSVEDLAVNLGWSTVMEPSLAENSRIVEDLVANLGSSTRMEPSLAENSRIVEDLVANLGSSTRMEPSLAESSRIQATRIENNGSDSTEDCQLVQGPILK